MCCVPLITQRGPLGTLTVGRRSPDGFTPSEVSLLGDVAGQVAIAVANTLAYQEISALKDRLTEEKLYLEDEISSQHDFTQIVGTSQALTSVLRQIRTVGPTDATVLLLGETGTGKELLARALHDASRRRAQTFVRVNGAALPAALIESELFGYEKGAFTGATPPGRAVRAGASRHAVPRRGRRIPLDVQPKLLRALQEQEFERLGSTRTRRWTCGSSPPPTAISTAWWPAARSAATSTTASACSRSSCRRCASARKTSRRWCTTSCASSRARSAAASTPSGRDDGGAAEVAVAGQHPRARERDRARRDPVAGSALQVPTSAFQGHDAAAHGRRAPRRWAARRARITRASGR
jgi:hypothetical protein